MPARVEKIDDLLDQFVRDLHVRTKATSYRCALRKFHASLGKNGWNGLNQGATPPMAASSVDRYSRSLGGSSCPVGDSIPRLVG